MTLYRYFVTGTDTDVGKTRVAAALAAALRETGEQPVIVKAVQTGISGLEPDDAAHAGRLSGCAHAELARFQKRADPWSAARAQRARPLRVEALSRALGAIAGAIVVEGSGGLAVPLNRDEDLADLAVRAKLQTIVVVGLRLGCINHALLTSAYCVQRSLEVAGAVLVDRWGTADAAYVQDVRLALHGKLPVLGTLSFQPDERASIREAALFFAPLFASEVGVGASRS